MSNFTNSAAWTRTRRRSSNSSRSTFCPFFRRRVPRQRAVRRLFSFLIVSYSRAYGVTVFIMFYNPRRSRDLYRPGLEMPYRLSRSKLELFIRCPRCFYLDCRLGVAQPPGYPFSLNNAVDTLLKKEFDIHRANKTRHPLMEHYGLDAVPFQHPQLAAWRNARSAGITYLHAPTNFFVTGGIDDVWVNPAGELIVVDYKATSKTSEVNIDAEWQDSYKRQIEVYQWLFRRNGFPVSRLGYFVYANGSTDREAFDGRLEFSVKLIPYEGSDAWVEGVLSSAKKCLDADMLPERGADCEFCRYYEAVREVSDEVSIEVG